MNNFDFNDFNNWQNGDDENDMRNPNNWNSRHGFFFYGPGEDFKKMWENAGNQNDFLNYMKDYLNVNDIMNQIPHNMKQPKKSKTNKQKTTIFSQEDYLKLIEIRGYLAINEQFAHVKALDKLLNQIQIIPKDNK